MHNYLDKISGLTEIYVFENHSAFPAASLLSPSKPQQAHLRA
eukprot:COSAG01_NODE_17471_length_1149_cov_1.076190_2_plen_41_part_01